MQPKKQLKVQYIGIFEEIRLFLLTKNALLKRGPKSSGMGRPSPPSFGQCPKENVFFPLTPSLRQALPAYMTFCLKSQESTLSVI